MKGGETMDINKYINDYVDWLKNEITFTKIGEYYEITTPYLDSNNDYIQIYVKQENQTIFFSDDSYTLNTLKSNGLQLTKARKQQLDNILMQFGVEIKGSELISKSGSNEFPVKKHMFIQAILHVSDMYLTSRTKAVSYFIDDIQSYFADNDIYYTDNAKFTGKSGFTHNYDFVFQRTKNKPERLCLAINNPTKQNMGNTIFAWNDTKLTRKKDSSLIVILNDNNPIPDGVLDGFSAYDINAVKWSNRDADKFKLLFSA
jgi:hypothetical protein